MDLRIKDVITLSDNNEYVVVSTARYQNGDYLYLVDINNMENNKFCQIVFNNNDALLLEITDDILLSQIIPKLYGTVADEISE